MEIVAIVGVVLGLCLVLSLFAVLIRVILVKIAKHHGFGPNEMPMHYHMFGIGIYFTGVFLIYVVCQLA
jgi:ABC-type antimicrobial peptide transport system permease subunit